MVTQDKKSSGKNPCVNNRFLSLNAIFDVVVRMKVIVLLAILVLLVSCTGNTHTIFMVDPEEGSYRFLPGNHSLGPVGLMVNGHQALEGAFLFHGADSLVAISSMGKLDIISIFKGDSTRGTLQIIFFNSGEENQAISQLKAFTLLLENKFRIVEVNAHRAVIEGSNQPSSYFCLRTDPAVLWDFSIEHRGDSLFAAFNGSGSSIVLLPEEKLSMPPLEFFFHLCPD